MTAPTSDLKIDPAPPVPSAQERPRRLFYDDYHGASVSVIIPVHNEEDAIVGLIQQIVITLKGLGRPWEVVVIDDGSTDGTLKRLEPLEVKVIAHPNNGVEICRLALTGLVLWTQSTGKGLNG